jgi:hypothetical protein
MLKTRRRLLPGVTSDAPSVAGAALLNTPKSGFVRCSAVPQDGLRSAHANDLLMWRPGVDRRLH